MNRRVLFAFACLAFGALQILAAPISLSNTDARRIGQQIWRNECGGTIAGLTAWNAGEDFASLGIGHFIWYPADNPGPFEESFPRFLIYARVHGATLPPELDSPNEKHCPWNSRAQFLAAQASPPMTHLREFLVATIALQTDFLVQRSRDALPKILEAAPGGERVRIARQFDRLANSAQGCYVLVDYVNFKGEGVLATERYHGEGWGLLQVLEKMHGRDEGTAAASEFSRAAAETLRRRVALSPPERHETRWLAGWLNRVATYRAIR